MNPNIVSPTAWLEARTKLLAKEKELTRLRDELATERAQLPWVRVEMNYVFDAASGKQSLSDLFAGKSQLVVWHFMMGPGWSEGCPSCSMLSDHIDGALPHLAARDVEYVAISRAPYAEIAPFRARMGWKFNWVSSFDTQFNRDFHVSFTQQELAQGQFYYNYGLNGFPREEAPGLSVFIKDEAGAIYHTYSSFARGAESMLGVYAILDLVPKGRDEAGLPWPMAWVRHRDRYGENSDDYGMMQATMKYALLIYEPQANFDARAQRPVDDAFWAPWRAYHKALVDAGVYVGGNPLDPPDTTATTIRVRGGERRVQDGPYADTKEQLGGFILFELPSLDEAIAWAAKCPAAHYGTVEVRPVADLTHIFGPEHGRGT